MRKRYFPKRRNSIHKSVKISDETLYFKLLYFKNSILKLSPKPDTDIFENIFHNLSEKTENTFFEKLNKEFGEHDKNKSSRKNSFNDIGELINFNQKNRNFRKNFNSDIVKCIDDCINKIKKVKKENYIIKNITEIKKTFNLSGNESETILINYLFYNNNDFSNFFDRILNNHHSNQLNTLKEIIKVSTNITLNETRKIFSSRGNLFKYGIIDSTGEFSQEINEFIEGISDRALEEKYFSKFCGKPLNLNNFSFNKKAFDMLKSFFENNAADSKILFYGKPGTGKTEFARSLGKSFGFDVVELKNDFQMYEDKHEKRSSESSSKIRGIVCFENSIIKNKKSLLIVDECDDLLNSENFSFFGKSSDDTKKSKINNLLDSMSTFQIWITNEYRGIHESTLRRFDYSLKFPDLSVRQREFIWKNVLKKHRVYSHFSSDDIEYLSEKYEVNAGTIEKSVSNSRKILKENFSKENALKIIENTIASFAEIKKLNTDNYKIKKPSNENYSLDGLNINGDITQILQSLKMFAENCDDNDCKIKNLNLLLWGAPGTGKTEFAKYTARFLKKRLIVKQASDLLNPYVGVTESNIRKAFDEAESDNAILFIDEIDSFLSSREKAQRSWEISIVNELLTGMEKFKGIFIASTNFFSNLDSAAARRFSIKIKFDFLTSEGNLVFYKKFFEDITGSILIETEEKKIKSLSNLSCGDFKVVRDKFIFYKKAAISNSMLIDALEEEVKAKRYYLEKKIGF